MYPGQGLIPTSGLEVAPNRKYHLIRALKNVQEFHREEEIHVLGRVEEVKTGRLAACSPNPVPPPTPLYHLAGAWAPPVAPLINTKLHGEESGWESFTKDRGNQKMTKWDKG